VIPTLATIKTLTMQAQPRKALIVEDTVSNLKLLEAKLINEHFDVQIALDGVEALAKLDEHEFDIVLLDVMLPGIDGFEVCRRIKRHLKAGAVPVIMITALDKSSDRTVGFDAGADDFFVKPVEDAVLFGRVYDLMRERANGDRPLIRRKA
jgi:two-component system cell cycle response regulator